MSTFKDIFKMQSWEEFFKSKQISEEQVPTNTTDGVENPDSPTFKMSRFAGVDCVEVDDDTYHKCKFGKKPFSRWKGYIEDEPLRDFVQKQFQKSSKLMIQNNKTGSITYLKR